jgi:AcrR family transcriptional regulator
VVSDTPTFRRGGRPGATRRPTTASSAQVLAAARHLIGTEGLPAMTIARLSAESGMSNGSIYHHFGSRGGIIRELYLEAFAAALRPITDELDDRAAAIAVPAMARAYVLWCAGDRARARILYEGIAQVDDPLGLVAAKARLSDDVVAWFAARARDGELRSTEPWELDPIVMAPAHECVRRHLISGGQWNVVEAAPNIGRAVWGIVRL